MQQTKPPAKVMKIIKDSSKGWKIGIFLYFWKNGTQLASQPINVL